MNPYKKDDIVYRDFNDIDILVNKKDTGSVNQILCDLGFQQGRIDKENKIVKASRQQIIYMSMSSHQEYKYVRQSKYSVISPYNFIQIDVNTSIFEGGKKPIQYKLRDY